MRPVIINTEFLRRMGEREEQMEVAALMTPARQRLTNPMVAHAPRHKPHHVQVDIVVLQMASRQEPARQTLVQMGALPEELSHATRLRMASSTRTISMFGNKSIFTM